MIYNVILGDVDGEVDWDIEGESNGVVDIVVTADICLGIENGLQ